MEFALDANIIAGLLTLIFLEIVLGIDNLVFIAILANRLPPHQRDRARVVGLVLALLMRLVLLASISWLITLTQPLITLGAFALSGRDLILLGGGLFLLFKATLEIHERLEGRMHPRRAHGYATFPAVLAQIVILDMVFSLDSVITAVGMVDQLWVMMTAVVIAMSVMILASKPLTRFVSSRPTVIMLCLGFLLMIGLSLIAEGFGAHIPKGYLYAAIVFSIVVETFNQIRTANEKRRIQEVPLRQRTADAILRLFGGRPELGEAVAADGSLAMDAGAFEVSSGRTSPADMPFAETERSMIAGVLRLGERTTRFVMTPRQEVVWLDVHATHEQIRAAVAEHGHARYLVSDGPPENLENAKGVLVVRDILPQLIAGKPVDLLAHLHPLVRVSDQMSVIPLIELLKTTPTRLAVVTDEHGDIEGIVTATDVFAAIAGDLVDGEIATPKPERLPDGSIRFDGATPIDEAADMLGRAVLAQDGDYTTVAGFVLSKLDRIPKADESFEWEGWRFVVTALEGHRIETVVAHPLIEPGAPDPAEISG